MRCVGTVVRGIRTPIIKENDDLATIVVDSLMAAKESEGFEFKDRDVVAITEAVVGISQGNYCSVDDIAADIKEKFKRGVTFLHRHSTSFDFSQVKENWETSIL